MGATHLTPNSRPCPYKHSTKPRTLPDAADLPAERRQGTPSQPTDIHVRNTRLAGYSAHARAWGVLGVWWSCIFIVVGWGRRRAVAGCWLVAVVVRG